MRLLGIAPCCGHNNTLSSSRHDSRGVACDDCKEIYRDWLALVIAEKKERNVLLPVSVDATYTATHRLIQTAGLTYPRLEKIPLGNGLVGVLNSMLITETPNATPAFSAEGGICTSNFELSNMSDCIGLYVYRGIEHAQTALTSYFQVLRLLFENKLEGINRGEILSLPDSKKGKDRAWEITKTALNLVQSDLACRVTQTRMALSSNLYGHL